jgi:hypothetical protein
MDTLKNLFPATQQRVAQHSATWTRKLAAADETRLRSAATWPPQLLSRRIDELQHEWDVERVLILHAGVVVFVSLMLSWFVSGRWALLLLAAGPFLTQHALMGWCPPVPLYRALGFRTGIEIQSELTALQLLHGDYDFLGQRTSLAQEKRAQLAQAQPVAAADNPTRHRPPAASHQAIRQDTREL